MIRIGFYGHLGELIGREIDFDHGDARLVADLRQRLAVAFPDAAHRLNTAGVRACIDDRIVGDDAPLANVRHLDFLPPLSGG